MDFDIPDELALLARTVRDFVETRLQPIEKQVEDSDEIPDEIVREMAALGFFGLPFPEECGGVGAGDLGYCLALEQFGRTSAAFSNLIGAHTSIGSMSIYLGGNDEQRRRYLPDLTAGRKIAAFSLTEPSSGSDAASIQTTARKDGSRWLLNGTKIWVTNGPIADVVVVYAANDRAKGARGQILTALRTQHEPVRHLGLGQGRREAHRFGGLRDRGVQAALGSVQRGQVGRHDSQPHDHAPPAPQCAAGRVPVAAAQAVGQHGPAAAHGDALAGDRLDREHEVAEDAGTSWDRWQQAVR